MHFPVLLVVNLLFLCVLVPAQAQTIRDMAGQMLMVGFQHSSPGSDAHQALVRQIRSGSVGGVIYLKSNIETLDAVRAMNTSLQEASPDGTPVLIALDQEGGFVERLTESVGFAEIPTARDVALGMDKTGARLLYADLARRLALLGFNLNLGPVVDIIVNPENPVIARYGRSFSPDAGIVTEFASSFVDGHHKAGMLTALKHFPGHGSSSDDTHSDMVDITATWQKNEYEPFQALVNDNRADMIMVGHLIHRDYQRQEETQVPASLSHIALTDILRDQMGFEGVIITDDMEMAAITNHYGFEEAIIGSINAGADILLYSNTVKPDPDLATRILDVITAEAVRDVRFKRRIEQSFQRIVRLKRRVDNKVR